MRDDIHRNAPVPHAFRMFMKACRDDAGFHAEGALRAERAVVHLLMDEMGPNAARQLATATSTGDRDLFGRQHHLDAIVATGDAKGLTLLAAAGAAAGLDPTSAICDAVMERADSYIRGMEAHARADVRTSAADANLLRARLDQAMSAVDVRACVETLVRGERLNQPRLPRGPMKADTRL